MWSDDPLKIFSRQTGEYEHSVLYKNMIKSIENRIKTDLGANYLIFMKRIKNLNLTACLIVREYLLLEYGIYI